MIIPYTLLKLAGSLNLSHHVWNFWFLKYYISAAEELHDVDHLLSSFYQRGNNNVEVTAKQEIPN